MPPKDRWVADIKGWRDDDRVCEILDITVPALIEGHMRDNYGEDVRRLLVEYARPAGPPAYRLERYVLAYDRLVRENRVTMCYEAACPQSLREQ